MADSRPRNRRPRNRGGRGRLADRAVVERHDHHIAALHEALEPEARALRDTEEGAQVVERIRKEATQLAQQRLEGDVSEVVEAALDEIFGLGPLEPVLRDPSTRRIRIVGAELFAGDEPVARGFRDSDHAHRVVSRVFAAVGKTLEPEGVSATMMDGSTIRARLQAGVWVVEIRRGK